MSAGIYKIRNLVTNECYIGSSLNLNNRKHFHLKGLRKDSIKINTKLREAASQYGIDNLVFEVLEIIDVEDLSRTESDYLLSYIEKIYFEVINPEYNIVKNISRRPSKLNTVYIHDNNFPVSVFNSDGNLIKHFNSVMRVVLEFNIQRTTVTKCCNYQFPVLHKGFIFRRFEEGINTIDINSLGSKTKGASSKGKLVLQFDLEGNFIKEWTEGITNIAKTINLNAGTISAILAGRQHKTKGFTFKYKN